MKKILTLVLAAVMLLSSLPAAIAEDNATGVSLDPMSPLKINAETGYIENLAEPVSVSELLMHFENKAELTVTDAKGNALGLADLVSTGASVSAGDSSVKALIHGDIDGDAKINIKDAIVIVKSIAGAEVSGTMEASDVTYDGKTNIQDAMAILKQIAGWDVDLRNPDALGKLTAEHDDADIGIVFDSVMNRVAAENVNPSDDYTYTVKMAKNEIEDVQIFLTSAAQKTGMSLEITDPVNVNGKTLETEKLYGYYYKLTMLNKFEGADFNDTTEGRFVDPLPVLVNPFDLNENQSKTFVVKVKTTPETEAGLYKSTVTLRDADGKAVKTAEFFTYVWNFTLDEKTASTTAFGLGNPNMTDGEPEFYDTEIIAAKYVKYYDYLLENRVSAYGLPYDILDPRADKYMSDPRVTSFIVAGSGNGGQYDRSDESIVQAYEKLKTDPVWFDKGYIYTVDEPVWEGLPLVKQQWEWAKSLLPDTDFQIVLPLATNTYDQVQRYDSVDYVADYINIWCPQSYAFKPFVDIKDKMADREKYPSWMFNNYSSWTSAVNYKHNGLQFKDKYESFRERGDKMWWYICCAPEYPHPNFFQSYPGFAIRLVLWQQYMLDIDGLLYWGVTVWEGVSKNRTNSGDGLLLYWGTLFGQEVGPVTSIRFESVRDGIEDFQYFTQLERLTDRATAEEYVHRVTTEILRFSEDHTEYAAVRDEVGFYLEYLYNAQ